MVLASAGSVLQMRDAVHKRYADIPLEVTQV